MISNTISPAPTDIWKLSGPYIRPTVGYNSVIGYYRFFKSIGLKASLEVYYKDFLNLIEYKDGADLLLREHVETEIVRGNGRAYGAELLLGKRLGKWNGWLSYTLSRSEIRTVADNPVDDINNGDFFPTNYDRTHYGSMTTIYQHSKRASFSLNFVIGSGRPFTFPAGKFRFDGVVIPTYNDRNEDRMPVYHRLDLSMKLHDKPQKKNGEVKKYRGFWVFSVYNLYSRKNVTSYLFVQQPESSQSSVETASVLGSFFPSVTYNFSF